MLSVLLDLHRNLDLLKRYLSLRVSLAGPLHGPLHLNLRVEFDHDLAIEQLLEGLLVVVEVRLDLVPLERLFSESLLEPLETLLKVLLLAEHPLQSQVHGAAGHAVLQRADVSRPAELGRISCRPLEVKPLFMLHLVSERLERDLTFSKDIVSPIGVFVRKVDVQRSLA